MEVPKVDFSAIKTYGDGSQKWRTVSLMFKEDKICWIMDSPNEIAKLQGEVKEHREVVKFLRDKLNKLSDIE